LVGGAAEQVTAVIVEPNEDLHAAAVPELPVGEVRLPALVGLRRLEADEGAPRPLPGLRRDEVRGVQDAADARQGRRLQPLTLKVDRKSTRLNSSHVKISYAVFCLKKKKTK